MWQLYFCGSGASSQQRRDTQIALSTMQTVAATKQGMGAMVTLKLKMF